MFAVFEVLCTFRTFPGAKSIEEKNVKTVHTSAKPRQTRSDIGQTTTKTVYTIEQTRTEPFTHPKDLDETVQNIEQATTETVHHIGHIHDLDPLNPSHVYGFEMFRKSQNPADPTGVTTDPAL